MAYSFVSCLVLQVFLIPGLYAQNLTERPQVARRIFLEAVKYRLSDLKIIQARLKHWQKRLLVQKIIEAGKQTSRDAKVS